MRKPWLRIVIIILLAIGVYIRQKNILNKTEQGWPSTIDALINAWSWNDTTWSTDINVDITAGGLNYEWGGEYATYSAERWQSAQSAKKRIIIVFEREGDPTGDALHDDIVRREARIPKNTVIFFANIETEASVANTLQVDNANTIVYINNNWEEIRRIWNGVITLAQIVNGIDGLMTN